ncbi:hypothetical protein EXE59_14935 [Nocardioides eburneiflavus]|uniref:D-isomer specific 2-hydroxyacid dehydrogenase NAD-binding domain-containing protein n=1 Tax=Nocardioides eburneiflavus TaxID=2518372 RepID=A0A4Z1BV30_9ACTN|nr:NAD(P)-dependent oxidoreductase [Nocardioides eburneiflavus]TGN65111.1 hypothetical protein EXE59_14935 [Nocardioides eburneiflavus]
MSKVTDCVADEQHRAQVEELDGGRWAAKVLVWDGSGLPPDGIEQTEVLLTPYRLEPMNPAELAAMPALDVVQLMSAGFETWEHVVPADVALCAGRGLHGSSTAEVAVAGILTLLHQHPTLLRQQWDGIWQAQHRSSLEGSAAFVIGPGDIGRKIATVLEVFGATVTLVGRRAAAAVVAFEKLSELLAYQDVIVLAAPLTEATRGLVDAEFLAKLGDGAIVVNISRGPVIDTDALADALGGARIRAVLDVTDPELLPAGHRLWSLPGQILTPHVRGASDGWDRRADELLIRQLERRATGQPLLYRVH